MSQQIIFNQAAWYPGNKPNTLLLLIDDQIYAEVRRDQYSGDWGWSVFSGFGITAHGISGRARSSAEAIAAAEMALHLV